MGHFELKIIVRPQNSGCSLKNFNFLYCEMGQETFEFILLIFDKKILLRVNGLLWAQRCYVLRTQNLLLKVFYNFA